MCRSLLLVNPGNVGRGMEEMFSSLLVCCRLSCLAHLSMQCRSGLLCKWKGAAYVRWSKLWHQLWSRCGSNLVQKWPHRQRFGICQHPASYHHFRLRNSEDAVSVFLRERLCLSLMNQGCFWAARCPGEFFSCVTTSYQSRIWGSR